MDIQLAKYHLIKKIIGIRSRSLIEKLLQVLQKAEEEKEQPGQMPPPEDADLIDMAREPIPEMLDVEAIAQEQGYSTEALTSHFRNLDRSIWQGEDVEEILELLKD